MYGGWLPFVNLKSHVDHDSSLIISGKNVSTATRNYEIKSRVWRTYKRREDWYECQTSQNENGASDEILSADISKFKEERRHCDRNRRWIGYSWVFFLQNFLLVYATCRPADSDKCTIGLFTMGRTWPKGDIFLEYGQPLTIYCMLNNISTESKLRGRNASDLVFFRNDVLVESEYITVVNETAIMMHMEQPPPSADLYYCKLKTNDSHNRKYEAVCLNKVVVGFKPKQPRNFSCVPHNWEKLVCSWEPLPNYIPTQFTVQFKLPGRSGRRLSLPCPVPDRVHDIPPNTCLWDVTTYPIYRQVQKEFVFTLNAENVLGTDRFTYKFDHWAHVIPSKPVNLLVINKTSSSALLRWNVPFPMQVFPPGLIHRISYQNQRDPQETWQTIDIIDAKHTSENYFNLTDLQHANAVYTVRTSLKSSLAVGEDKWSQFSEITFKTDPKLPGLPPKTDIGSFEIARSNGNRDVYIYWQTIPQYLENGDNFTYQVVRVEENGQSLDLRPHEITETYAKFEGVSFNDLKFEIVSANCRGANNHKATVHVRSQLEIPQKPVVFTKIAFEGSIYELSWGSSSNADIVDYTIFWCENDRDRPYQCSGYLDWIHVPRNTQMYNVTLPDPKRIYQFAIAANTAKASSGMAWFSSMTTLSNVVGKMKSVWINRIESDLIEVGWDLEYCGRIGIIESFNINHCPIVSAHNLTCDGPKTVTKVPAADRYMMHGVVRNLRPHTTYLITVTMFTNNGVGLHSDALYIKTLSITQDLVSKNSALTDTPSNLISVPFNVNVSTKIEAESSFMDDAVEGIMDQHCNENVDCELDGIDQLDSNTTDYIGLVNNLTSKISAYKKQLNCLSDENRQLREFVLMCNEVR